MKTTCSAFLFALVFAAISTSCAGRKTASAPASPSPSGPTGGGAAVSNPAATTTDPNSIPEIARREVIRRQEMVRQMDEAAIRASQRMAEDDLEGAVEGYQRAMGGR